MVVDPFDSEMLYLFNLSDYEKGGKLAFTPKTAYILRRARCHMFTSNNVTTRTWTLQHTKFPRKKGRVNFKA